MAVSGERLHKHLKWMKEETFCSSSMLSLFDIVVILFVDNDRVITTTKSTTIIVYCVRMATLAHQLHRRDRKSCKQNRYLLFGSAMLCSYVACGHQESPFYSKFGAPAVHSGSKSVFLHFRSSLCYEFHWESI